MVIAIDARPMLTEPRTGVGEYTYELLSHLFQIDQDNTYILFANKFHATHDLPFQHHANVSWVSTRIPNKLFHASLFFFRRPRLDRYVVRRAGVDRVDVWFSPNLLFTSLSPQVKHLLTIHDLSYHHYPSFFSQKGRLWHRAVRPRVQIARASHIFTPSLHTKRDVEVVYGASSVSVLSPGVCSHIMSKDRRTISDVQQAYALPKHFLLYLGTLEPRKNIEGILEAYQNSSYLKKHTELIFAGSLGYKGHMYTDMIAQVSGARYIGYVDEEDKHALYTLAQAFVYPSLYEGFGLPVLEASVCGTPVITSHRSSLPEVVGESGSLVQPYNISVLQAQMERVVHMNSEALSVSDIQTQQFSWDGTALALLEHMTTV